jgi:cytochrome c oxidase subunit I
MASETIALSIVAPGSRGISDRLHDWAITVDHKRLGILYILYALLFLVIGGVEATIMRVQLITAHNHFVSPEVFNRMFTMHGTTMIFCSHAAHVWFWELFDSLDDRCAGHGLPAT